MQQVLHAYQTKLQFSNIYCSFSLGQLGSDTVLETHCPEIINKSAYHLPDLHYIVFWYRTNHPGLIGIPGEVRDLGSVTTVNKLTWKTRRKFKNMMPTGQDTRHSIQSASHLEPGMGVRERQTMTKSICFYSPTAQVVHLLHLQETAPLQFCWKKEQ